MESDRKSSARELLQAIWQGFTSFFVAKSDLYFQPTTTVENDKYTKKVRFYAFLPAEEEQRDWLDKVSG